MSRKVLLIEPNYKNKYPPLSLMKLATYHRQLGDEVTFYKGTKEKFAINETMKLLVRTLQNNDSSINWLSYGDELVQYLVHGSLDIFESLVSLPKPENVPLVQKNLIDYRKYFRNKEYLKNPQWDRICITTLFTFYWKETIDAINFYKQFCKDLSHVYVGGIAASVVPQEMANEAKGVTIIKGLLNHGGELDKSNTTIIDELPLDYSILEEIDYKYPEHDGFYGYMTRGCVNKCPFCVVPTLEPSYEEYLPILDRINTTRAQFGEKRNLLLLDNNVLASPCFNQIIDEIKKAGFYNGATYVAPNYYEIALKNIKNHYNINGYLKNLFSQYELLLKKTKDNEVKSLLLETFHKYQVDDIHTISVDNVLAIDNVVGPLFAKLYKNKPKVRYVDFNQGLDARLFTPEKAKKLSEIPIRPLRIAFDHWELRDKYQNAVRLAAENGIKNLSNYLLYNFHDRPVELYYRLKMNVELCEQYDISIYSFPMKYHPISDPNYFRVRTYLGEHWTRKYIRAIQAILNSTKGKIGRGTSFFEKAFGSNEREFYKLLYMPEVMIVYRLDYEKNGLEPEWWQAFQDLSDEKRKDLIRMIEPNDFSNINALTSDDELLKILRFYEISRKDYDNQKKLGVF